MMHEMQRLIETEQNGNTTSMTNNPGGELGELSAISPSDSRRYTDHNKQRRGAAGGVNESSFIDPDTQHYSPQFSLTKDLEQQ